MPSTQSEEKIVRMLHPLEQAVLPLLSSTSTFSGVVAKSGLKDIEVMRALEWLENKKLITSTKIERPRVTLGSNGETYKTKGLPERRVLNALKEKPTTLQKIQQAAEINTEELNIAIGVLRRAQAITLTKGKELTTTITGLGKALLKKETIEEKFLKKIFPLDPEKLDAEEKYALEQFQKRKDIVHLKEEKDRTITITPLGQHILAQGIKQKAMIGRLTPELLRAGAWKKQEFRHYDVTINVPPFYPGKKHMVTQAVDYIKRIWLELGFKEMTGNMLQTAFWDLDALFVPQDHPAREMQDTFYLAQPEKGELPRTIAARVKAAHENGGTTGSSGWGYRWSEEEAKKLLLITHDTYLSAQTLSKIQKKDLPIKTFQIMKVFRNETADWKHLFEFYQVGGIVVDENANFCHLKGYLRAFFAKMGFPAVRIRPAHFPYVEPGAEVDVFHPIKNEWVELGGAGIFRPEVVVPLVGSDVPVLAWGLGLERIISSYYSITDLRDIYKNDLKCLREAKLWVR